MQEFNSWHEICSGVIQPGWNIVLSSDITAYTIFHGEFHWLFSDFPAMGFAVSLDSS